MFRHLRRAAVCATQARCVAQTSSERHVYASVLQPETVTTLLQKAQARDIVVMNMREKCSYTDYFVLATGNSQQHLGRLGQAVLFQLKQEMRKSEIVDLAQDLPPEVQGDGSSEWVLVDAGSILVHLMTEQKRAFLDLQSLWETEGQPVDSDNVHPALLTKDTITTEDSEERQDASETQT